LVYELAKGKCGHNSHGYFDFEYSDEKPENTYRIVVIGDSVAQGQGVRKRRTFSNVLEWILNSNSENKKYEVITIAVSGYSTSQELILLEREAAKYSPDLIIWSYVLNDPAHPVYQNANGELGRYFYSPRIHVLDFIQKKLFLYNKKRMLKNCRGEYHMLLHCVNRPDIESNIKKIAEYSNENKIPVIFLIHPIFERDKSFLAYSLGPVHKDLKKISSEQGLITLDILEPYRSYHTYELGRDPWHPNIRGRRIAAEYIYECMKENILNTTN
jgi:lysophospholipase L1-like esterase